MSGKSTYLKQVALIAIMAQIGCFVPATFAALRPFDKLFARVGGGVLRAAAPHSQRLGCCPRSPAALAVLCLSPVAGCLLTSGLWRSMQVGTCDSIETNSSSFMVGAISAPSQPLLSTHLPLLLRFLYASRQCVTSAVACLSPCRAGGDAGHGLHPRQRHQQVAGAGGRAGQGHLHRGRHRWAFKPAGPQPASQAGASGLVPTRTCCCPPRLPAGIAWAMCEHFLARGTCALFATHFKRLEELASLYPNCKLWHMQVGGGAV
jgi:hypothetical protein